MKHFVFQILCIWWIETIIYNENGIVHDASCALWNKSILSLKCERTCVLPYVFLNHLRCQVGPLSNVFMNNNTKIFISSFLSNLFDFSIPRCFHSEKSSCFPLFPAEVMKYISANYWNSVNYFISEMTYFSMNYSKHVSSISCRCGFDWFIYLFIYLFSIKKLNRCDFSYTWDKHFRNTHFVFQISVDLL